MTSNYSSRINELRDLLATYKPGSTIRFARQRPRSPPPQLRIGLFGPTGVGKSAFINSANYATGLRWDHIAPEGFAEEASKTVRRNAYDVAEYITLVDNRGMRSLGGPFMAEIGHQIAGVYGDGEEVTWERGFVGRVVAAIKHAALAKLECQIQCAVLCVSAVNISLRPSDLKELITTIQSATGEPPIVVITHRRHPAVREAELAAFRSGLQEQRIDYVFEVENYTISNHEYSAAQHLVLLEAIYQCAIVGDRVMKNREDNADSCTIL